MQKKFELLCQGDSRLLRINGEAGESFFIEPGTMAGMTPTWKLNIKTGGVSKMLGRVITGDSVLLQEYKAIDTGELLLAPIYSGDILGVKVGEKQYRISNGNFLACTAGVELEVKAKVKGIFGTGEGLFSLRTKGDGILFVNSCGSLHRITLQPGEEYIIDSGHLVLWDRDMKFSTKLAGGGIAKSIFSGEGFVASFVGPGDLWIQTRKPLIMDTTVNNTNITYTSTN